MCMCLCTACNLKSAALIRFVFFTSCIWSLVHSHSETLPFTSETSPHLIKTCKPHILASVSLAYSRILLVDLAATAHSLAMQASSFLRMRFYKKKSVTLHALCSLFFASCGVVCLSPSLSLSHSAVNVVCVYVAHRPFHIILAVKKNEHEFIGRSFFYLFVHRLPTLPFFPFTYSHFFLS